MRNDTHHDPKLVRLGDLDDFKISKGDPDIRGWEVKAADGRKLGKVDDLIVDTGAMRVRYFELKGDKKALGLDDDRHLLIPIGTARLDENDDNVFIDRLPAGGFAKTPRYTRGKLNREYETSLRSAYGMAETKGDFYGTDLYEDRRFFGKRRHGREGATYLTRSEEELAIGKRQAKAGEVEVKKEVETEHVKKAVPTTREEVTVERRPATSASGKPKIGEDEITVPVMEEEVVVEKRAVPKEEIVIKKEAVRDQKTVEADLKKERVDVDKKGDAEIRGR